MKDNERKHAQNQGAPKEGGQRISVRPGNFNPPAQGGARPATPENAPRKEGNRPQKANRPHAQGKP